MSERIAVQRARVFGDGEHGVDEHTDHHDEARSVGYIIDADPMPEAYRAEHVWQETSKHGTDREAHRVGPLRFRESGLDIHIWCGGFEGLDKPSVKRA